MDIYSRTVSGKRVWYADIYVIKSGRRTRARRSTGVRDDGTARSRRAAEIAARALEQSLALGQDRGARQTTLEKAIAALVDKMELEGNAQATIGIAIEKAERLFDFFGATTSLESCRDTHAYAKAALAARAPATVLRELKTLAGAFRASGLTPPELPDIQLPDGRERFLTPAEQLRLLAATPPERKDHIVMYLHCGLSKSELWRIAPTDCNFDRNEVRVRGTKAKERDRLLPMTPEVRAVLLSRRGRKQMFEPWEAGNADRDLRLYAKRAELGPLSFNDLRRTYATTLAAAGVPILHLMHLMGHASTRMLEKVYARVGTGDHMHEAVKNLPRLRSR